MDFNAYTFQTREILDLLDLFLELARQGKLHVARGPKEEAKEDLGTEIEPEEPEVGREGGSCVC